jgi:hypothetical protein
MVITLHNEFLILHLISPLIVRPIFILVLRLKQTKTIKFIQVLIVVII